MKELKDYIDEQKYTGESDFQIISRFLQENDLEEDGMKLIVELSQAKLSKVTHILNYARTWLPTLPDMYSGNKGKVSKGDVRQFNRITEYYLLGSDLPDALVEWAKTRVPQMNTPRVIFVPMVEWLKEKYQIEFNDHTV